MLSKNQRLRAVSKKSISDSDGYLALSEQLEDKQFAERSIRNCVGDQGDLQTPSERLGHASTTTTTTTTTTQQYYRRKPTKVVPLSSQTN
jgi:hypothetical protein